MEKEAEVVLVSSDWDSQSDMSEGDSDESGTRAPEFIDLTWSDASAASTILQSLSFVKFLTKQIKVCQGCRAGYQRDAQGHPLPPPYDILVGH